jgi:hypothetical protein
VVDRDQVSAMTEHPQSLQLTFRNGDSVSLPWRDESERQDILNCFPDFERARGSS